MKNELLSLVLTMDDMNNSYYGIISTLINTYSSVLKECVESGSNIPNHFDFQKYQVTLCYDKLVIPSDERDVSELSKQKNGINIKTLYLL